MKPHSITIDDFLDDFEGWRAWADTCDYQAIVNPRDGVSYEGIFAEVPTYGIQRRLSLVLGAPVRLNIAFMRLSLFGHRAPHQAHTDAVMGQYSAMVYLNRPEHCQGGTALVRHYTGFDSNPANAAQEGLWKRDTNDPAMWMMYSKCEMKSNRAFIFRADLMHSALPYGGFGVDATDGRLVMTAFFDL